MRHRGTAVGVRIARGAVIAAAAAAAGCTWVKLTGSGEGVHVGTPSEVASCQRLGATHAKTSTKVGIFTRNTKKIDQEIETLARNEAAEMGGNTIVPQGPTSSEGRRSFDVFRCSAR